jgi:hypothetical protein
MDGMPKRGPIEGVEVRGEVLLGTLEAMGPYKRRALSLLSRRAAIQEPKVGEWYPLHALIYAFDEIFEAGGSTALRKIGAAVSDSAKWPAGIDSLEKAIGLIDVAYHMNHRRDGKELIDSHGNIIEGGIGHDVLSMYEAERRAVYVCESFYHCDFDFGMAERLGRKFKPITVQHDDTQPCRRLGGDTCTYLIHW